MKFIKALKKAVILVAGGFVFFGCANKRAALTIDEIKNSPCNLENVYQYTKEDIPAPLHDLHLDTVLSIHFSESELNIANAMGVLDLLTNFIHQKQVVDTNPTIENRLDFIQLRQDLNERLDLVSLEISSVAAELDCEEERLRQIAFYLNKKEKRKETHLTVGTIIIGSLAAIITGVLVLKKDESHTADWIGAGAGVAEATLGVLILTSNSTVPLEHKRNVLREIWLATETSTIYPPSIWYYLNYQNLREEKNSLREQLILNWKNYEQIKDRILKEKSMEIYFSNGGLYSIDELENRANMYDQLESVIKLMKQDLRNLTLSLRALHE